MPLNQLVCEITDFIENIILIIVKNINSFLDEIRVILGKNLVLPAFSVGVPAEKAVVLSAAIFFSAKNLKKGFPLQSLTCIELIIKMWIK